MMQSNYIAALPREIESAVGSKDVRNDVDTMSCGRLCVRGEMAKSFKRFKPHRSFSISIRRPMN